MNILSTGGACVVGFPTADTLLARGGSLGMLSNVRSTHGP